MRYGLTFEVEPFELLEEAESDQPCQCAKCRGSSSELEAVEFESGRKPVRRRRTLGAYPESLEEDASRPVRANFVTCNRPNAAVAAITGADPVATIQRANRRAIELLNTAIDALQTTRNRIVAGAAAGFPTVSDALGQALQNRFHLDPNTRATWTSTAARSVHVIIRRLRGARQILADGWMKYTCLGPPAVTLGACQGPGCPADRPNRRAVACGGHSRIVLCRAWWSDSLKDQAATLLHECIHIYFGFIADAGSFGNAHCYEHLVLDLNGLAPQAGFEAACP
jgi:hypothetical protein